MSTRQLMETLVENEEILIDGISLSLRHTKYGRSGTGMFDNDEDAIASMLFLTSAKEDEDLIIWRELKHIRNSYGYDGFISQGVLNELRKAVFTNIKTALRLLANIDKAKESIEFREVWKERVYGNSKEANDSDKEV